MAVAGCGRLNFESREDDAAIDAPVAPVRCGGALHTFCDDFDRASPAADGWLQSVTTGGTLELSMEGAVSPPKSLHSSLRFPLTGVTYLATQVSAQTSAHVELDVQLEATDVGGEVDLVALLWLTPPAPCTSFGYILVRDRTGIMVMQETYVGCGGNLDDNLTVPAGVHHIAFDLAFAASHLTVSIDGVMQVDKTVSHAIPAGALELRVGMPGAQDTTAPWEVSYDNVVVDTQ
jgi:hypothetical protein